MPSWATGLPLIEDSYYSQGWGSGTEALHHLSRLVLARLASLVDEK